MQCHYCDRDAAYTAESGGIVVGLCSEHFRERLAELSESEELATLKEQLDVSRTD